MNNRTKILIVGGGKGGTALTEMFHQDDSVEIVGIVDVNDSSPGLVLARELGIPTSNDYKDFLGVEGLAEIVNVTGLDSVQEELLAAKPRGVEVIGGHSSELLWRLVDKHAHAEEVFLALNKTLIELGNDFSRNVEIITSACGEALGGDCALYNRLEEGLLCSVGRWHCPEGYEPVDAAEGHVCCDVINSNRRNEPFIVEDLESSEYQKTDPNVKKFGLKSYIGCPVCSIEKCIGSLCVLYSEHKEFDERDKQLLRIFADVLSREEERNSIAKALRESEESYRMLVETGDNAIVVIDREGKYHFINSEAKYELGIKEEEDYSGKSVWDYFPKEQADHQMETIRKAISTGEKQVDQGVICVEGEKRNFQATIKPINNSSEGIEKVLVLAVDITDLKRAEAQVAESRDYLEQIINAVADPIFVKGRDHKWIMLNDAFCEFMGYAKDELIGRSDYDYFPKEEAEVFWAKDEEVFETKAENINEEKFTDSDGVAHTIITKKTLHVDEEGKELLVGVIRDVTKQKKIEEALSASEEKYRILAENTSDNIWTMDLSGKLLYTSKAAERIFGFTVDEILNMGLKGLLVPESFGKAMQLLQEAIASVSDGWSEETLKKEYTLETEMYNKSGRTVFAESVMRFFRDAGGEIRILGVTRDVTERRQVQEELRLRAQEFSLIFENTQDAIFWVNPDTGIFINCNSSAEELLGRTREEILGQPITLAHPQHDGDKYEQIFRSGVANGKPQSVEAEVLSKSGEIKYVLISATLVTIGEKKIMQGVFHDITRRKKAEIERAKQRELIDKTNRELMWKIEELEAAMSHIKKLEGLVPICANCKKMRLEGSDPQDPKSWQSMERYISDRTDASFTHGLCPECVKKMYGDALKRKGKEE